MLALDERKAGILRALVSDYVRGGGPVGSKRLVEDHNLAVSAATVRADLAFLEAEGYIAAPHTSAGRVPTDKGYRYFVDTLGATATLSKAQRTALEQLLLGASDLEELLRRTSGVLSRLTRFAALVVAPRIQRGRLRHLELVLLAPTTVLAVVIGDTGRVEKRLLTVEGEVGEAEIARARHAVNEAAAGLRADAAAEVVGALVAGAPAPLQELLAAVAEAVRTELTDTSVEQVFVGGSATLAGPGYFDRIEQVQQVYEAIEEQVLLLESLRQTLSEGDPAVRIGSELSLVELAACSIVAASYGSTDTAGSVGVLGPTRMDYPRTLAAVKAVASSLEKALAELPGGP